MPFMDTAVNYSNSGDCLPRHLPPLQPFPGLDTCRLSKVPGDGSNTHDINYPHNFALSCQHLGWHRGFD